MALSQMRPTAMNGEVLTASFGVTEIQRGDTPESMLRRADLRCSKPKSWGDMVVQLGGGLCDGNEARPAALRRADDESVVEAALVTTVPLKVAIAKLRGFVLDHHAEVVSIEADRIDLKIEVQLDASMRRRFDRPIPLVVSLTVAESRLPSVGEGRQPAMNLSQTRFDVAVRLKRARDRNNPHIAEQAGRVVAGIRSYLMATNSTEPKTPANMRRAVNLLSLWQKA